MNKPQDILAHERFSVDAEDLISLNDLLVPLWQGRWTILIITALFVASAAGWTFLRPAYESNGYFQFGTQIANSDRGFPFGDFKRYAEFYSSYDRFNAYVKDQKINSAPEVNALRKAFSSGTGISPLISPVYPFTQKDAKVLPNLPKISNDNIVGWRIVSRNSSPAIAQQMVTLLGKYAMDSIVYLTYSEGLRAQSEDARNRLIELDNMIINDKVKLDEYRRKSEALKAIIARNPAAANEGSRQVVQVTAETARYLPPVTLLMTTEVRVSEVNDEIFKATRERLQEELYLQYYQDARKLLGKTKSGDALLLGLDAVKEHVFKSKDMTDDRIKEVYNAITIANQRAIERYMNNSGFISGPTLPTHSTTRLSLVLAASILLGLLASMMSVFGRNWWRANRVEFSGQGSSVAASNASAAVGANDRVSPRHSIVQIAAD